MQNNLAIFYCGTNGAGKTTLRGFNKDTVQIVIDSDHIAMEINPKNPRLADIEAGRKAVELSKFALKNQISFSMESTLSGKSVLNRMKQAKEQGFTVRLNYIGVNDPDINVKRVQARVQAGGHFIDEQTIRQRFEISRKNLITALSFCDEALIYDNSAEIPEVVFHIENGKITQIEEKLVEWCENLRNELLVLGYKRLDF
ncbi:zeta toxin family protein [Mannheimia sp. AT1]|uniref:Zeta toxin family protein n=1 Tax=Mannheimia cairinae TaxID=3025936 RepID=A0ABT5MQE7_9PAST|nr:zeta toxin family protein [Mannheimia cairinae]MDD0823811.1 zeta toxin family protein [Mannheimia cairinae]MDD0825127.1 zeta toxin family protein [Mannheimia cairinae]